MKKPPKNYVSYQVTAARAASAYFRFLGGAPTDFDRIEEVHTRMGRFKEPWARPQADPSAIKDSAVRYYANPLERLVKMHQSYQEIVSGLVYRSPFETPSPRRGI